MMRKLIVVWGLALLALSLAACGGGATEGAQPVPTLGREQPTARPSSTAFDVQTSDAGRVVIDVTPLTLSGDDWHFDVALNTHSVSLDFDLTEVSVLRCDQGQEYAPAAWEGDGPGGHHRSGVLKFASLDHPTSFVEIVVRDVAVPERVFRWEMPRTTGSSAVTQSSPATDDGPAHLVLSGQEFHFGEVIMSQGVVAQTMEITNSGPGRLRIEKVEPT